MIMFKLDLEGEMLTGVFWKSVTEKQKAEIFIKK